MPGHARATRHLPIRQVAGLYGFSLFAGSRARAPPLAYKAGGGSRACEASDKNKQKDKRDRSDRVRKSTHLGKPNRPQVKWPGTFIKPTPKELEDAPGKHIHFQGYMKASAPNVLQISLYRGRGLQWTSN